LLLELVKYKPEPQAPVSGTNALRDAHAELELLRARIPSLRISGDDVAKVSVDGHLVAVGELVVLDPGPHAVEAELRQNGQVRRRQVELAEGQQGVEVIFRPEPKPLQPLRIERPQARVVRDSPGRTAYRRAAWIAGGASAVAAVVGTVAGLVARSKLESVRAKCHSDVCPPVLRGEVERARDIANISTTAFGIAAGNAVVCLTFTFASP
jgi:hypothetical protein